MWRKLLYLYNHLQLAILSFFRWLWQAPTPNQHDAEFHPPTVVDGLWSIDTALGLQWMSHRTWLTAFTASTASEKRTTCWPSRWRQQFIDLFCYLPACMLNYLPLGILPLPLFYGNTYICIWRGLVIALVFSYTKGYPHLCVFCYPGPSFIKQKRNLRQFSHAFFSSLSMNQMGFCLHRSVIIKQMIKFNDSNHCFFVTYASN